MIGMSKIPVNGKQKIPINSFITLRRKKMAKCKKCHHDCHCNEDLHADEMSYENEIKYDG